METGALLLLLRDRLMFVLRDGASPCAAAATPAPQRALLPCAPPKQQARPPWALWLGSFARVCLINLRAASSTNALARTHCGERAADCGVRAAERALRRRSGNRARLRNRVSARAAGRAVARGPSWSGLHLQAASRVMHPSAASERLVGTTSRRKGSAPGSKSRSLRAELRPVPIR